MPLLAQILVIAGMASMFLAIGSAYVAAPKLKAYLKRQTPSVDVPDFDYSDQHGTRRLTSLLWTVNIPSDRPRLRKLVLAHRTSLVLCPILMLAGGLAATVLPSSSEAVAHRQPGAPPNVAFELSQ